MKWLLVVALVALVVPALAAAQPAPVTWCGTDEVPGNRVPDLEVSASEQVRFLYVVPQDGVDQFLAVASGIATDAAWIDEWWTAQDPSRTPRFDRYPFASCGSKFGALDIGFTRLPFPAASFSGLSDPSISLDPALAGSVSPDQKTVVYYDGPIQSKRLCGETDYLANTSGGSKGIVYVYLQSSCDANVPGLGGTAEVAAHELLHNLGAVPPGAPNECPGSESHACDSESDVMDQFLRGGSTLDKVSLDVNHDDYYAHSGTWWDVQDSAWLSHLPQRPFALAVSGSGSLIARASGAVLLPCDAGCTGVTLDDGTPVSVIAVPAAGWKFSAWSGNCSGTRATCTLAVGGDTSAAAAFVKAPLRVTVAITGRGTVRSTPARIACPGACTAIFGGRQAKLAARPAAGWKFAGWSGACSGRAGCTLTLAGTARAKFARR